MRHLFSSEILDYVAYPTVRVPFEFCFNSSMCSLYYYTEMFLHILNFVLFYNAFVDGTKKGWNIGLLMEH